MYTDAVDSVPVPKKPSKEQLCPEIVKIDQFSFLEKNARTNVISKNQSTSQPTPRPSTDGRIGVALLNLHAAMNVPVDCCQNEKRKNYIKIDQNKNKFNYIPVNCPITR